MRSVICVHERFDGQWPFAADYWHKRWQETGNCELFRTLEKNARIPELVSDPTSVQRLVILGMPAEDSDLTPFTNLEELYHDKVLDFASFYNRTKQLDTGILNAEKRGVSIIKVRHDIHWGQSVAEYALGMTIAALRKIPQSYKAMMTETEPWQHNPVIGTPGKRGGQFSDDPNFSNGTISGKRVRIAGAGNIGGRYASFCTALGAEVKIWDPFAPDVSFALSGAERCFHKAEIVKDAEIFAPMLPPTKETLGLIDRDMINNLPAGCLVLTITRAAICDTKALYQRVLNDEISLSADVFDSEPVPFDSPLLGRHNVVHTAHNAGRTIDANQRLVDDAIARFRIR